MLHPSDSKSMAKTLRAALAERNIAIAHSDALEIVARQFGLADWNTLSARIDASAAPLRLPPGWFVSHPSPDIHRIGLDPMHQGVAVIETLPGAEPREDQTGVLMQSIAADVYRGQTIAFSADLQTEAAGSGTLWMRIDGQAGRTLRFDNMMHDADRALRGTTGWRPVRVVLDVPDEAATIHFGMLLVGKGRLRARGLRLDPVAEQPTGRNPRPPRPANLGFKA
jgi:hypothetical protein